MLVGNASDGGGVDAYLALGVVVVVGMVRVVVLNVQQQWCLWRW